MFNTAPLQSSFTLPDHALHLRCGLKLMDLGASDPPDLPLARVLLRPSLCEPRLPCLAPSLFLSPGVRPPTTLLRTRRGEVDDMGLMEPSNLKLGTMWGRPITYERLPFMHFITSIDCCGIVKGQIAVSLSMRAFARGPQLRT